MSVELTPQLIKVPNISGRMGPGAGPPPLGMRGGPRGGGGFMRGGPPPDMIRGGFRGGRGGGFHDGPPPIPPHRPDFEFDSFHGRRDGFGRGFDGGFRGGRGGGNFGRGGDDGFHGGRDGGGFGRGGFGRDDGFRPPERGGFRRDGDSRGGFNKRPRSPPPGGFKGDDAAHSKMPRRDDDGKWGSSGGRQDFASGPRGGRGGRGGFRPDGGNWNQPGGGRQSEPSKPPFPAGGQPQQQQYGQNVGGPGSSSGPGAGSAGGSGAGYGQQPLATPPASGYGQAYGQQPPAQPQQNQQSQAPGYTPAAPASGYGQQGYDPNAAANMAAYGQQTAAYGQSGYGQAPGYGAQSQDPNAAYAGYGQASSADYYQAYQAGMVQYPGYQTSAAGQQQPQQQQTAQSWGMMSGAQQYWSGDQQQAQPAASWPTGAEGTAVAATTDPNAAYWAAAGWKPT